MSVRNYSWGLIWPLRNLRTFCLPRSGVALFRSRQNRFLLFCWSADLILNVVSRPCKGKFDRDWSLALIMVHFWGSTFWYHIFCWIAHWNRSSRGWQLNRRVVGSTSIGKRVAAASVSCSDCRNKLLNENIINKVSSSNWLSSPVELKLEATPVYQEDSYLGNILNQKTVNNISRNALSNPKYSTDNLVAKDNINKLYRSYNKEKAATPTNINSYNNNYFNNNYNHSRNYSSNSKHLPGIAK